MNKLKKILISFFLLIIIFLIFNNFATAENKPLTPKELPYKTSLDADNLFILSKGFDELNVLETYTMDIYSKKGNNIILSEIWTSKEMPNKELIISKDTKISLKSEQSILYQDNIALYFITIRFYFTNINDQKLIAEFTYRKMF